MSITEETHIRAHAESDNWVQSMANQNPEFGNFHVSKIQLNESTTNETNNNFKTMTNRKSAWQFGFV